MGAVAGDASRRDAAALAGLAALLVPYAVAARRLWWSGDDPALLRFVAHHPGADYLWSSAAWQELPWRVFAPLQLADFQLDAAGFGVASPGGFYAHHLAVLAAAAVALYLLLRRCWATGRSFLAVALLLYGPPLPATLLRLADRHYVLGLLLAVLALHAHLGGRGDDEQPPAAAALALVAVVASAATAGRQQVDELARQGQEGRFALTHDASHLLRRPVAPAYYLGDVGWLARRLGSGGPAGHFADDYYLCTHDLAGRTLWAYDAVRGEIVEQTTRAAGLRAAYCGRLRDDVALDVRFERGDDGLAWELGPFDDGTWVFLVDDGRARFEVAPAGRLRGTAFAGHEVRVLYESPAGWLAVSPTL